MYFSRKKGKSLLGLSFLNLIVLLTYDPSVFVDFQITTSATIAKPTGPRTALATSATSEMITTFLTSLVSVMITSFLFWFHYRICIFCEEKNKRIVSFKLTSLQIEIYPKCSTIKLFMRLRESHPRSGITQPIRSPFTRRDVFFAKKKEPLLRALAF